MIRSPDEDLHVLKYFSSVITVSEGRVINVTEPLLRYCPLAFHFFGEFKKTDPGNPRSLSDTIQKAIESKIRDYGFFTKKRSFHFPRRVVPYGASEMLAASLKNGFIEAAVVVCDGAGTLIAHSPETVQGIGARMNTLIFTSPVKEIQQKLKEIGCHVVSENTAEIDQARGVEKAISLGYRKIGVTVAGFAPEQLERIRFFEKKNNAEVTTLAVCTTGISSGRMETLRRHADLVWACASDEIREKIGNAAILQLSKQIPVYALTSRGVSFAASCFEDPTSLSGLDIQKQYLVQAPFGDPEGCFRSTPACLSEMPLPAGALKRPFFQQQSEEEILP